MSEDFNVHLGGDASGLTAAFAQANHSLEELGHAAHGLAGAFAFHELEHAFDHLLEASEAQELALRKFSGAMQAANMSADPARMLDFAAGLQRVTTYGDETTIGAAAMMSRFRLSQDQIERMLPSVADLASFMGRDLTGAADDVGRAIAQGGRALQGLGLGFTTAERAAFDMAGQNERINILMQRMGTTVAGFAHTVADSAVGSMHQFKNTVGDLEEEFGALLNRPVASVFHALDGVVRGLTANWQALNPAVRGTLAVAGVGAGGLGAAAAGVTALAGALGTAVRMGPAVSAGFRAAGSAMSGAFSGVLLPIAAILAGIAGVVLVVGALRQAWDADLGGMQTTIRTWAASVGETWVTLMQWIASLWDKFTSGLSEKVILFVSMVKGISPEEAGAMVRASNQQGGGLFGDAVGNLKAVFEGGKGMLTDAAGNIKQSFTAGVSTLKDGAKALGIDIDGLVGKLAHLGTPEAEVHKTVGADRAGPERADFSLKDILQGHTEAAGKRVDADLGNRLVAAFGGSDAGFKAAAAFMSNVQLMSGLSADTLTSLIGKTGADAGKITEVSTALRGVSDQAVGQLLKAGASIDDLQRVGPAIRGMSDAVVTEVLRQSNGSVDELGKFGAAINHLTVQYGLSAETFAKQLSAVGGDVSALDRVGMALRNLTDTQVAQLTAVGTSLDGMKAVGNAVNGLSHQTVDMLIARTGGAVAEMTRLAPAFKDLTDETINSLMDAAHNNVEAAAAMATQMKSLGGQIESALGQLAGGLAAKTGAAGAVMNGAMQGFQSGGPWGAVAGAAVEILSQGEGFKKAATKLSGIFTSLGSAFDPLFDALGPILETLSQVFASFGAMIKTVLSGLQPVFAVISGVLGIIGTALKSVFGVIGTVLGQVMSVLGPILRPIISVLNVVGQLFGIIAPLLSTLSQAMSPIAPVIALITNIMDMLSPVLNFFMDALKAVAQVFIWVFKGIAYVWNGIIALIAKIIETLGGWIPGIGDSIKNFADKLRDSEVDISSFDRAVDAAGKVQDGSADATAGLGDQSTDTAQALQKTADASESLTNAAQGWSVSLARFQTAAASAGPGGLSDRNTAAGLAASASVVASQVAPALSSIANSSSSTAQQNTTNHVTVNVTTNDADTLWRGLQQRMQQNNFNQTGTAVAAGNPFSTPATVTR